ncbi:unnamed protein product [Notodromas monacha]|uniref:Uncharacterized protein n=1 Tax=Notodromas monacha TaxID=399045 RepID=A0A7R9BW03_9CRUS|nr:unnamed protein product [Notodromas monacha]CAG0921671.1 unnamed protein product [Notodromas monacha]
MDFPLIVLLAYAQLYCFASVYLLAVNNIGFLLELIKSDEIISRGKIFLPKDIIQDLIMGLMRKSELWERLNLQDEIGRQNCVIVVICGILFFSAWWLVIDTIAVYPKETDFDHRLHIVTFLSSLSMLMVNLVSNDDVHEATSVHSRLTRNALRLFLLASLVLGFGAMSATTFFVVQYYILEARKPSWPGVAFGLENVFILASSLMYRFGRREDPWDGVFS